MTTDLKLDRKQVSRALDILADHQSTLERYFVRYKWLKATFYVWFVAVILMIVAFFFAPGIESVDDTDSPGFLAFMVVIMTQGILLFVMVVLFLLNLPFGVRILKQERLRRRLGIDAGAQIAARDARKPRVIMLVASVIGVAIAGVGAFNLVNTILKEPEIFAILGASLIMIGGITPPLLWLLSRGVDRLDDVARLREQLSKSVSDAESPADEFELTALDYDRLSRLEKRTMQMQREQSVKRGFEYTQKQDLFAVQRSSQSQTAIEGLDSDSRLAVEKVIFDLMTDPRPGDTRLAEDSLIHLRVPDTSLTLLYDVDDDSRNVRLHYLQPGDTSA